MFKIFKAHQPYLDLDTPSFVEDGYEYPLRSLEDRLAYCGGVLRAIRFKSKKLI